MCTQMMSGSWNKLKRALSFKSFGESESSSASQVPPQSDSQSSFSSRFGSSARSSKKTCAICLRNVRSGQGQAIFVAECSHSFHFRCITSSVKHGNYICPICRSTWKEIPLQQPNPNYEANINVLGRAPVSPYQSNTSRRELFVYDEPIVVPTNPRVGGPRAPSSNVSMKVFPEIPALGAEHSASDFAVLVGVRAPQLSDNAGAIERAPIDLVTVLDTSGSMHGQKLILLKQAVCFVIDNLGPNDRLSIVSFSETGERIFHLRRMTGKGREEAKRAVNRLSAEGGTCILEGLVKGVRVIQERRERNPVANILLLSDGRDNQTFRAQGHRYRPISIPDYLKLLPHSIRPYNRQLRRGASLPVHTFGFGSDHDSCVLHGISDASGGTYSFIESLGMVQDAFARCIGGLLSVVAQELQLTITSASPNVKINSMSSGKYVNEVSDLKGVINVGDMYADEEKSFFVHISIPVSPTIDELTPLLYVTCSYKDIGSKSTIQLEAERAEIRRPAVVPPEDRTVCLEVNRQKIRLWVAEGIVEAQQLAEAGNLVAAQALLKARRTGLVSSTSAQAGDDMCNWLQAELMEMGQRMMNREVYERTGLAYTLSGLSSHLWQRATTRGDTVVIKGTSNNISTGYSTPSMVTMVSASQDLTTHRELYQQQNKSTNSIDT